MNKDRFGKRLVVAILASITLFFASGCLYKAPDLSSPQQPAGVIVVEIALYDTNYAGTVRVLGPYETVLMDQLESVGQEFPTHVVKGIELPLLQGQAFYGFCFANDRHDTIKGLAHIWVDVPAQDGSCTASYKLVKNSGCVDMVVESDGQWKSLHGDDALPRETPCYSDLKDSASNTAESDELDFRGIF